MRVVLEWPAHNAVHVGDDTYFCLERGGRIHVLASRCPHRGGPLHLGRIDDGRLRCPWHGSAFRLDWLCDRGVPAVRVGSRVVAYLPAAASPQQHPLPVRQMVLAHERSIDV